MPEAATNSVDGPHSEVATAITPRFLGVRGAAIYASLSEDSIRSLLARGKLTKLRPLRGKILIDRQELESLILSSTAALRGPRRGHKRTA
jgi:hypothetical protein